MKVVLTSGHQYSGFNLVHQALLDSGLTVANLFRDEQCSAEQLQAKIVEAYQDDINVSGQYLQLNPSKLWQGLASDLFVANFKQDTWGWADSNTLYLLNYWRDFDPRTRFILVYASPVYALKQLLKTGSVATNIIDDFFEDWLNVNTELLSFYNRNKGRCVLVNIEALTKLKNDTEGFACILKSRLDIELNVSIKIDSLENDVLVELFTTQLNQEYPDIKALYQELESVADTFLDNIASEKQKLAVVFEQYANFKKEFNYLSEKIKIVQQELTIEKQKPELSQQLKNAQDQVISLQQELATNRNDLNNEAITDLQKENELLLLQLHQVQEELEHYFLKYQEALEVNPTTDLSEQVVVDLRKQMDGYNWWHAEHDGRWAGPGLVSNIKLPELKSGLYQIKIEIVDAIVPETLKNTQFFINNKSLSLVNNDYFYGIKQLLGLRKRYPVILTANVKIDRLTTQSNLEFKFSKVISPSSKGSDDFRALAIRVKSVELKLLK